jgi:2,4'-dihydroxyacetophenone dioxygenase
MSKPNPPLSNERRLVPYPRPQPPGMAPDQVLSSVLTTDERLRTPVADGTCSRPPHLSISGSHNTNLLRLRRSGVLQRHRHSVAVHAYVIRDHVRQFML